MFSVLTFALTLAQTPPAAERTTQEIRELVQSLDPKTPLVERLQAAERLERLGPAARPAAPALIRVLRDDDVMLRRRAVAALAALMPTDLKLIDPLLEALPGDDAHVQHGIGKVLAGIGPIATTRLHKLLQDDNPVTRRGAALALEPFGIDALASVKTLLKALADPEPTVRFAVAKALAGIEPKEKSSYPVIAEGMLSKEALERREALELLTRHNQQALATPFFRKMLTSGDERVRADALRNLRQLGAEAVAVFVDALTGADAASRRDAAAGLFDVLQHARRAVMMIKEDEDPVPAQKRLQAVELALGKAEATLTKLLKDPDPEMRFASARTLYFVHRDLEKSLPIFAAALREQDDQLRRAAVKTLRDIPDSSARVLKLLVAAAKDSSPDVRLEALTGLWLMHGETEIAQTTLVESLEDPALRQNVYAMIHRLIGQGHDFSGVLIPLLQHADDKVRARTVALLRTPGVTDDKIKSALFDALKDKSALVRLQAVQAITHYHEETEFPADIVPPLLTTLSDESREVRMATVVALRRLLAHGGLIAPALGAVLRDEDGFVRAAAADTLSLFREEAVGSVPALVKALREEDDEYVRERLVRTLALFGPDARDAVPQLLEMVRQDDPNTGLALLALSRIGPDAKAALPVLIEALEKNGASKPVQDALTSIGLDAAPHLIKLLEAKGSLTRQGAAAVLGRVGPGGNSGAALTARLKDADARVRVAAALAHFQVTGETKAALAALEDACKTRDRRLRLQALKSLQEMGPAAAAAVPLLVGQLSDPDPVVRQQVEMALMDIDPEALERARAAM